jgi:hypothetical protein
VTVMSHWRPYSPLEMRVEMRPLEAAIATWAACCLAKSQERVNGARQARRSTLMSSWSSVALCPIPTDLVFAGEWDAEAKLDACFLGTRDERLADFFCNAFPCCHL